MEDVPLNIFTRVGIFIEKHWPEKMTTAEVAELVKVENVIICNRLSALEKLHEDIKKLKEDLNAFKTQSIVKTRIVGTVSDNMTPFASRLKPVMPANGGNGSPQ